MEQKSVREAILLRLMTIMVLACTARSWADPVVYFRTDNPDVVAGQTISVEIFTTLTTGDLRIDRISDDAGGLASNLWLNPGYHPPLESGTIVNFDNVLIEDISSYVGAIFPAVTDVLYSFDYTVPQVPTGTQIDIFCDPSDGAVNRVFCNLGSDFGYVTPDSLTIEVVPEPASILLFGLSLQLLRRRPRTYSK